MDVPEDLFGLHSRPQQVMYMILFPELAQEDVLSVLDSVGVPGFTELAKVTGRGARGRHYDTHVWPGADSMIYCVVPADQSETLRQALASLSVRFERTSGGSRGLHVFTWACEQQL